MKQGPTISIVYITKRPGTYDILFNSLASQTSKDYELICIDELVDFREKAVRDYAQELDIHLKTLRCSKPKSQPSPFGYSNAMNTGLMETSGQIIVILQDFAWLPETFIERIIDFYKDHYRSLLGFPNVFYLVPEEYMEKTNLDDSSALSVFKYPLTKSPDTLCWKIEKEFDPSDAKPGYNPHWFWECYCCAAPWSVYEELNGFDEWLDFGDDCHERNIRDRAGLIGYDIWIDGSSTIQLIEHKKWRDDLLWLRRLEHTNFPQWLTKIREIADGKRPIRSYNGYELKRNMKESKSQNIL